MTIEQVNALLKGKRPVSANQVAKPTATKPDVVALRTRIAEAREAVGDAMAQASKLGALALFNQTMLLRDTLTKLEAELAEIR